MKNALIRSFPTPRFRTEPYLRNPATAFRGRHQTTYLMFNLFVDTLKNRYAQFEGRARRKEYWGFVLVQFLLFLGIVFLMTVSTLVSEILSTLFTILYFVAALGLFVPGLALAVRRLHDTGRSGWFLLIGLIPFVGLVVLYFMVQDSQPGSNQYGPNPKEVPSDGMIDDTILDAGMTV